MNLFPKPWIKPSPKAKLVENQADELLLFAIANNRRYCWERIPSGIVLQMYVSSTMDGTIYTSDISGGPGHEGIAVARRVNGEYQKFAKLGAPINISAQDMYPFIAPDESYLIFNSRRPAGNINSGMFVSWRQQDGTWCEPQAIDLGMNAGLPLISPDGKYFFFTAGERGKSDIYWVSAKIIEKLKPRE